jgi:hypothetical protein
MGRARTRTREHRSASRTKTKIDAKSQNATTFTENHAAEQNSQSLPGEWDGIEGQGNRDLRESGDEPYSEKHTEGVRDEWRETGQG